MASPTSADFHELAFEFTQELEAISQWWSSYSVDHKNGGFLGEVSDQQQGNYAEPKGVVATARILWYFSEVAIVSQDDKLKSLADRAYAYTLSNFVDTDKKGVFWSVNSDGSVLDPKKQTYAQAFAIYGYVSYYKLTGDESVIAAAKELFALIENHAFEAQNNGYREALSSDWKPVADVRLSEFDANFPYTMNTHLHIMEAYTALYAVAPEPQLKSALKNLIKIHIDKIICGEGGRLGLFFDEKWADKSSEISHGHNIEASWLLWEACLPLKDEVDLQAVKKHVIALADACYEKAFVEYGYVINETDFSGDVDYTSIWWVQAEALIGFLNAYQLTGLSKYFDAAKKIWDFTKKWHIDDDNGEWFWSGRNHIGRQGRLYKAGMWKAPYHNGRAMLEGASILNDLNSKKRFDDEFSKPRVRRE